MIRFKLRELISRWEFKAQRRLTLTELGEATGIVRTTLSRMTGPKPFNSTTNNLDELCRFFDCQIGDLVEYVHDADPPLAKNVRAE